MSARVAPRPVSREISAALWSAELGPQIQVHAVLGGLGRRGGDEHQRQMLRSRIAEPRRLDYHLVGLRSGYLPAERIGPEPRQLGWADGIDDNMNESSGHDVSLPLRS